MKLKLLIILSSLLYVANANEFKFEFERIQDERNRSITYSLTINQTPTNSRVQITNIEPRYYDGIKLQSGTYDIMVRKKGYYVKKEKINLQSDMNISINLKKKSKIKQEESYKIVSKNIDGWDKSIFSGNRSYSINSANTVKDKLTGLVWQKGNSGAEMDWNEAQSYCKALLLDEYSDWRLPSFKELYYLTDRKKFEPSIDTKYFNEVGDWYWSSTEYKDDSSKAWNVIFTVGNDFYDYKSSKWSVRCVKEITDE